MSVTLPGILLFLAMASACGLVMYWVHDFYRRHMR